VPKKKAIRVRMQGEDLCVFKGQGKIYALTDICPHRGARLSEGDCHYDGTIACPYHGWVFDGEGRNVAVLSEGPNSIVCGKPGTEARSYPTKLLKGVVFVWMGDGEPAPIEEDVPEEFFIPGSHIFFNEHIHWRTNWEVALENSMDSHVQYLHRDNLQALLGGDGASPGGGSSGMRPIFTGTGFQGGGQQANRNRGNRNGNNARQQQLMPGQAANNIVNGQAVYPEGWKWPKHRFRRFWRQLFGPFMYMLQVRTPQMTQEWKWTGGHRLPGIFGGASTTPPPPKTGFALTRALGQQGGAGLYGIYRRQVVAVDEWTTRVWYHHGTLPRNKLELAWFAFVYFSWGRWTSEYNFSQQDMSVMLNQVYDAPEKLSGTDAEVVAWRKLVVTKHFGGRNFPYAYENPPDLPAPELPQTVMVSTRSGSNGNGNGHTNGNGHS
jgi:phenylpropionate dioxygenase-like ring-hydroxylating dioxygenase large terminal subunit